MLFIIVSYQSSRQIVTLLRILDCLLVAFEMCSKALLCVIRLHHPLLRELHFEQCNYFD